MPKSAPADVAEILVAELSAALPARKSALEFERHYAGVDQGERINRGLFQIRIAEARLKAAMDDLVTSRHALASLAVAEAEDLEVEAGALVPLLGSEAAGRQFGLLRLVCALFRLARLGEGRARAFVTFARQGKHLPGFEDVLELAPENELFFLAMRRFKNLLQAGGAWAVQDADWLRLRAAGAPGRLRLRAAALRSGALGVAEIPLPPALEKIRKPFIDFGFESTTALAWAVAGFSPKEALAWGDSGLATADQAQAWRDRGLDAAEAATWAAADLLPDEAAAFKACGANDPTTARQLRQAFGDVEHLLLWHRAGFEVAEVLRLRAKGVQTVADAVAQRDTLGLSSPQVKSFYSIKTEKAPVVVPVKAEVEPLQEKIITPESKPNRPPEVLPWAQERAMRLLGVKFDSDEAALDAVPADGGAWLGWGVFQPATKVSRRGSAGAFSLAFAGGRMDVAAESEGMASERQTFAPPRMDPRDLWQERLDLLRTAQGEKPLPGQWYLHAWAPYKAWLFWATSTAQLGQSCPRYLSAWI